MIRTADYVCFDVDSTVTTEEGIDVLAAACGKGEEVAAWTRKAMGGQVLFQDAIAARLKIIQPTTQTIQKLVSGHSFPLTPGMPELFATLRARQQNIILISGGLLPMIRPVAAKLNIPETDIYAIDLFFHADGSFRDFARDAPTARSGGKQKVMEILKKERGAKKIVMIGDGATDLEVMPVADGVIGFGANAVRDKVKKEADWFAMSTQEILDELNKK